MGQCCPADLAIAHSLSKLLMLDNLWMYVDEDGRRKVMTKWLCLRSPERRNQETDTPI